MNSFTMGRKVISERILEVFYMMYLKTLEIITIYTVDWAQSISSKNCRLSEFYFKI